MDFYAWLKAQWDRVAAAVLAVAGVVALYLGYDGVSHSTLPSQQIPYLASGGLLAVLFLGGAATLWLSADLRDEWRKLDEIHRELRAQREGGTGAVGPNGTSREGGTGAVGPNGTSGPGETGEPTRPVGVVDGPAADLREHVPAEPVAFAGTAPRRAPGARTTRRPSASK